MTETKKALVCEPLKDKVLLVDRIKTLPTTPTEDMAVDIHRHSGEVLLIFWHGVGDLVMFLPIYDELRYQFPFVTFTIGLAKGLTHEQALPLDMEYHLLTGDEVNETTENLPYDIAAKITFPMNEGQDVYTKTEFCCIHEIGIEPISGHGDLHTGVNRLVGVHFNITCLPDACNPDSETAEKIWNDILAAGYIPIETHFEHLFHNPVNLKFDFVDATVRRARPQVSSLVGLIRSCAAFVGVVSGNFHVAMSTLPAKNVMLLEKDFKKEHFTKQPINTADLKNYNGEVKRWLDRLEKETENDRRN